MTHVVVPVEPCDSRALAEWHDCPPCRLPVAVALGTGAAQAMCRGCLGDGTRLDLSTARKVEQGWEQKSVHVDDPNGAGWGGTTVTLGRVWREVDQ